MNLSKTIEHLSAYPHTVNLEALRKLGMPDDNCETGTSTRLASNGRTAVRFRQPGTHSTVTDGEKTERNKHRLNTYISQNSTSIKPAEGKTLLF